MIFRTAIPQDYEYMSVHCANRRTEIKQLDAIDYIYALEHKGKPLMVGGFRFVTPTTAWCWIDLSDELDGHLIPTYRVIKEWINEFAKDHEIKRLQAFVRTDFPEAEKMMRHLGFGRESTMKNFFGDDDGYMYVRVI